MVKFKALKNGQESTAPSQLKSSLKISERGYEQTYSPCGGRNKFPLSVKAAWKFVLASSKEVFLQ